MISATYDRRKGSLNFTTYINGSLGSDVDEKRSKKRDCNMNRETLRIIDFLNANGTGSFMLTGNHERAPYTKHSPIGEDRDCNVMLLSLDSRRMSVMGMRNEDFMKYRTSRLLGFKVVGVAVDGPSLPVDNWFRIDFGFFAT